MMLMLCLHMHDESALALYSSLEALSKQRMHSCAGILAVETCH